MSWDNLPAELAIAAFVVLALGVLLQAIARFIMATKAPKSDPPPPAPIADLDAVHNRLEATERHLGEAIANFAKAVERFESHRSTIATASDVERLAKSVRELEAKVVAIGIELAELRGEVRARYDTDPPPSTLPTRGE